MLPEVAAQWLIAAGALLTGVFGTHGVRRIKERLNGGSDADRIVEAIENTQQVLRDEGHRTRVFLKEHDQASAVAIAAFHAELAFMQQACAVSHSTILERVHKG